MSKYLAIGALLLLSLLLLSVACGAFTAPTLPPTATPPPTHTPAPKSTATLQPTPEPISESKETPTPTFTLVPPQPDVLWLPTEEYPVVTPTPTLAVVNGSPPEEAGGDTSVLDTAFPEISEKMRDISPVYTAYFHSQDWETPGKGTTVNEVFKLLKMENIATHQGHQPVSPAMVVDHEPDLIIADSIESIVENPDLSGLHMVQDTAHIPHHIFVLKEGYSFYVADPGFRDTVVAFASFAYPGTFTFEPESVDDHGEGHEETGHDHGDGHSHGH